MNSTTCTKTILRWAKEEREKRTASSGGTDFSARHIVMIEINIIDAKKGVASPSMSHLKDDNSILEIFQDDQSLGI